MSNKIYVISDLHLGHKKISGYSQLINDDRYINVCVEALQAKPISFEEIIND